MAYVQKWKVTVCQALQISNDAALQVSAVDIYPIDCESLIREGTTMQNVC